jgi:hypothetical protein
VGVAVCEALGLADVLFVKLAAADHSEHVVQSIGDDFRHAGPLRHVSAPGSVRPMPADTPSTIVLIHGLWMTPRSGEGGMSRGESDRVHERNHVPAKASRHNAEKYRESSAVTELKKFPRRPHFPGAPGREEVADYAPDWALRTRRS